MRRVQICFIVLLAIALRVAPLAACPECERLAKLAVAASGDGTKWSDPATWAGGKLPVAGQAVVIPAGKDLLLDVSPPQLASLLVKGQLRFDRVDANLNVGWLLVIGKDALLEIGTAEKPFAERAVITFHGVDEKENVLGVGQMAAGTKFLCAMEGGRLELHGARRDAVSWTQINAHAAPGDTQITLLDEVAWQAGDQICIAPSGYSPWDAELVTVERVEGKQVTFTPALAHDHWGTLQTFADKTLDERAEVGLLTRNIVLQGAEDSTESAFGGHVMIMPGGTAHVEGVEFYRMGQKGHQARYPLHWHLVDRYGQGDAPGRGQYAKHNSFHHSFQRAIVIHGTSDVVVERNVAYRITNHCYVAAEDGDEENNQFLYNLGMRVSSPEFADYSFPGPKEGSKQTENKSSVFWMTNPNQTFIGNHAAGSSQGDGFLFDRVVKGRKPVPFKNLKFVDNVAHSNQRKRGLINSLIHYGGGVQNFGLTFDNVSSIKAGVRPEEVRSVVIENFTAYKNASGGVWLESQRELLKDSILADHYVSAQFGGGGGCLEDVVIVRGSANTLGEENSAAISAKAKSTGLYLENGGGKILTKNLTFIGMEISTYGYGKKLAADQRIGWQFVDVGEPVYAEE